MSIFKFLLQNRNQIIRKTGNLLIPCHIVMKPKTDRLIIKRKKFTGKLQICTGSVIILTQDEPKMKNEVKKEGLD